MSSGSYYAEHRDSILAKLRSRYAANKEFFKAKAREYARSHPDAIRAYSRKRQISGKRQLSRLQYRLRERFLERLKQRHRKPARVQYMRQYGPRYYRQNRERLSAYWKHRYEEHKPEILQTAKAYRESHRLLVSQRKKQRYYADVEKTRANGRQYARRYYTLNREYRLAKLKEWRDKNATKVKAQASARAYKRHALLDKATINLKQLQEYVRAAKMKSTFVCYYCGNRFPISKLHFDHVVPLSKGGSHSVENLCTSCGHCNCSKNNKLIDAWDKCGQQILSL